MSQSLIAIGCALLILFGTLGALLPVIPGLPLALVGLWIYAIYSHFHVVTLFAAIAFTVFGILVEVLNVLAPGFGAKGFKSTRFGALGAMIGAVVGILIFGPVGIIVGPFLGAFIGEFWGSQNEESAIESAIKSARGAVVGTVLGGFLKLSYGLAILIYFIIVLIKH